MPKMVASFAHILKQHLKQHRSTLVGLQHLLGLGMLLWLLLATDWPSIGRMFASLGSVRQWWLFGLLLVLMPANWALETLKWEAALRLSEARFPLATCLRSVLLGLSFQASSPFLLGGLAGKYLPIKAMGLRRYAHSLAHANLSQSLVTILAALLALPAAGGLIAQEIFGFSGLVLVRALGMLLLLVLGALLVWGLSQKLDMHLQARLLLFSALRYALFSTQFLLALLLFGADGSPADLLAGVALLFLAKSCLPAVNLVANLGIREATAALVFAWFGLAEVAVAAALLVWLVNLLLPALIGTVLFLRKST